MALTKLDADALSVTSPTAPESRRPRCPSYRGPRDGRDEIAKLFSAFYQQIEARLEDPDVGKKGLVGTVHKIQGEVGKGAGAYPIKVNRWLETLAGTADDIFEVTVACLISPAAGIATFVRKVAEKAKEEAAWKELFRDGRPV